MEETLVEEEQEPGRYEIVTFHQGGHIPGLPGGAIGPGTWEIDWLERKIAPYPPGFTLATDIPTLPEDTTAKTPETGQGVSESVEAVVEQEQQASSSVAEASTPALMNLLPSA